MLLTRYIKAAQVTIDTCPACLGVLPSILVSCFPSDEQSAPVMLGFMAEFLSHLYLSFGRM